MRWSREVAIVAWLFTTGSSAVIAQRTEQRVDPASRTVESLLRTPGPAWVVGESLHFRLYRERPVREPEVIGLLDSLEEAWRHAVTLLGARIPDAPRATVLATRSRTRFSGIVPPQAKGLTTRLRAGDDVIVLVQNDSVRAYTRHEVMHLVARRAWGERASPWLNEGLATFADGRCQRSTLIAVGHDVLRARPDLTATDLQREFGTLWRADRYSAYVLAGSFVDFLWRTRGREGVRRLWQGIDSLDEQSVLPGAGGELTRAWRAHVERSAGNAPGIDQASFRRAGCG